MRLLRLSKFFVSLILTLVVIACHDEETVFVKGEPEVIEKEVIVEVPSDPEIIETEVVVDREVEVEVPVAQDFEGVWGCDNNGLIELYMDSVNRVYIEAEGQQLVSLNPKGLNGNNFADHPSQDAERLPVKNGRVRYQKNISYSSGNNLKKDSDNSSITGSRRTDYEFRMNEDRQLIVRIRVFDKLIGQSGAKVLANRTITCE